MQGRFEYVKFDEESMRKQARFKDICEEMDALIGKELHESSEERNATKALEEMFMWIGKSIRNSQRYREDPSSMDELMGGV